MAVVFNQNAMWYYMRDFNVTRQCEKKYQKELKRSSIILPFCHL